MDSRLEVNEAAYRRFLHDFTPDHLQDIVLALHEHAQATARAMLCADLETACTLSDPPVQTGVDALVRLLYDQALDWEDPAVEQLSPYVTPHLLV